MVNYKDQILEASKLHFQAHIKKHKVNVDILLGSHVGVAEHPDVMETNEKELEMMDEYVAKLEQLNIYINVTQAPRLP